MPDKAPETIGVRNNAIRLVRRANSPTWQAHFKVDKLGVWIRKSTKTQNIGEAREFAEEQWMEAKILAKQGHPVLSKKFKAVAEAVLIDLYRKIAESGTKRGSNNDYVSAIQSYLVPFFGSYNINRIAQQQINEFHQWRAAKLGRELSKSAQANHNAAMNLVLDYAVTQGYLMPFQRPVLKNTGEASGRRPDFSEQELKQLIEYLPTWVTKGFRKQSRELRELLAIYIPFVALTGMRPGTETEFLEWRHIELREKDGRKYLYCNVLKGKTAKKGKRMGFVMDDACGTLLDKLVEIAPEFKNKNLQTVLEEKHQRPVFRTRTGTVPEMPPNQFKQLLEEIGLLTCPVTDEPRSLYSLRHYAIGQAIKKGMTQQQLENYFRTSAKMLTQYYNHFDSEMNIDLFAGRSGSAESSDAALIEVLSSARQTDTIGLAELVTGLTVGLSGINSSATDKLRDELKAASGASPN
jgi:integrase